MSRKRVIGRRGNLVMVKVDRVEFESVLTPLLVDIRFAGGLQLVWNRCQDSGAMRRDLLGILESILLALELTAPKPCRIRTATHKLYKHGDDAHAQYVVRFDFYYGQWMHVLGSVQHM